MKKVFVSICIAGAALAMSSCRSVEKAIPLSSINGEWNIIEVNGSKITPGESTPLPFTCAKAFNTLFSVVISGRKYPPSFYRF